MSLAKLFAWKGALSVPGSLTIISTHIQNQLEAEQLFSNVRIKHAKRYVLADRSARQIMKLACPKAKV